MFVQLNNLTTTVDQRNASQQAEVKQSKAAGADHLTKVFAKTHQNDELTHLFRKEMQTLEEARQTDHKYHGDLATGSYKFSIKSNNEQLDFRARFQNGHIHIVRINGNDKVGEGGWTKVVGGQQFSTENDQVIDVVVKQALLNGNEEHDNGYRGSKAQTVNAMYTLAKLPKDCRHLPTKHFVRYGDVYTEERLTKNLTAHMKSLGSIAKTREERIRCAKEFMTGVFAMHKAGFAHRDLKPDNAGITKEGVVVVNDFGPASARTSPDKGWIWSSSQVQQKFHKWPNQTTTDEEYWEREQQRDYMYTLQAVHYCLMGGHLYDESGKCIEDPKRMIQELDKMTPYYSQSTVYLFKKYLADGGIPNFKDFERESLHFLGLAEGESKSDDYLSPAKIFTPVQQKFSQVEGQPESPASDQMEGQQASDGKPVEGQAKGVLKNVDSSEGEESEGRLIGSDEDSDSESSPGINQEALFGKFREDSSKEGISKEPNKPALLGEMQANLVDGDGDEDEMGKPNVQYPLFHVM